MTVRTEKQAAIVEALRQDPRRGDSAIARATGASRNLVRRVRTRLGLAQQPSPARSAAAPEDTPPERGVRWPKVLDPVFSEGGFADELEAFVQELVEFGGRLDKRLSEIEVHGRGHYVRNDRHRFIREVYRLAAALQAEAVPAGPCPFCQGNGCQRCAGGGWASASFVDAGALLEERNARARWWRVPRVVVPM